MQAKLLSIIFSTLFFSYVYSIPVKVSHLTDGDGHDVWLIHDAHEQQTANIHEARCEWFDATLSLLTRKEAKFSVVIEDMAYSSKELAYLFAGDISLKKLNQLVHKKDSKMSNFLRAIGCLDLDSRFTPSGIELVNVASPITIFVDELAPLLDELKQHVERQRCYLGMITETICLFVDRLGKALGFVRGQNNTCLSYTLDWLLRELLILKDYYEKVLLKDASYNKLKGNLKELNNHIASIRDFLNKNKLRGNLYNPVYQIFKDFMEVGFGEQENIKKLSKIVCYAETRTSLVDHFPEFLVRDLDVQIINLILTSDQKTPWLIFMGADHLKNVSNFLIKHGFTEEVVSEGYLEVESEGKPSNRYSLDQGLTEWSKIMKDLEARGASLNLHGDDCLQFLKLVPCSADKFLEKFEVE